MDKLDQIISNQETILRKLDLMLEHTRMYQIDDRSALMKLEYTLREHQGDASEILITRARRVSEVYGHDYTLGIMMNFRDARGNPLTKLAHIQEKDYEAIMKAFQTALANRGETNE